MIVDEQVLWNGIEYRNGYIFLKYDDIVYNRIRIDICEIDISIMDRSKWWIF